MVTSKDWLRANRIWLPLVPVALVLMLVGSSYRVNTLWWENGFHDSLGEAPAGKTLRVRDDFKDAVGETTRTFEVRYVGMRQVDEIDLDGEWEPAPVPPGMVAYAVRLEFQATPDQDLNNCQVSLIDSEGRLFGGNSVEEKVDNDNPCVPAKTPGPTHPTVRGDQRGVLPIQTGPRPERWTVAPIVLVAKGAKIEKVRLAWDWPEFVTLRVR